MQKTAIKRAGTGQEEISSSTAGYCKARQRLPLAYLTERFDRSVAACTALPRPADLWHGRKVRVVDATTFNMPDTPYNQKAYPQHYSQKPGCGFPIVQACVAFDLASAGILRYDTIHTGEHEVMQLRRMYDAFEPGSVMMGDRAFAGFFDMAMLQQQRVDTVVRKHQCLGKSLVTVKYLAPHDRLCRWLKPAQRPPNITPKLWNSLPAELWVRHVVVKVTNPTSRTRRIELITTLTDAVAYPARSLADLFQRRWRVELFLDDIKTVMGMDMLRCKSPAMVNKEIMVHFTAYNLIRLLMGSAAQCHTVSLDRLSFTATRDLITIVQPSVTLASPTLQSRLFVALLWSIAHDKVPHRPGRREPRAVKRRPKEYARLTIPRHLFHDIPHRKKYHKTLS